MDAYNFARRLKTLKGMTLDEFIITSWKIIQILCMINPNLPRMGPCT
ncbi:MAG: hypothetical protein LBT90_03390 [Holosporaceae bacterium]|nr:hypothetical protein [Holosporaceae bacterium]